MGSVRKYTGCPEKEENLKEKEKGRKKILGGKIPR
jgi:hypothetical protein